ncbi:rhomboid family protein [Yoonia maricola]|uniref:Rhomboid family protein n=1 Tax=Yoonia maricola TaxID=420999 RepID=A0A2M8W2Z6_9RHOB|nr:rhomboid family intramembrane serine protease [Yoonia maricola]PJI85312.1 rhomboid family protein [Yoonia maricola]
MKPESPFNALPPVVVMLTLLIVGIEVVFQLANYGIIGGPRGVGWRVSAINAYGYSPAILDRVLVNGDYSFDMLKRFVTYTFINGQLTQVAFCGALTLALGKFTAEYYGSLKVMFLYLATSVAGAIVFGLFVESHYPLIGGFTPVYGLIGAYTYALWLRLGEAGENQIMAFRLIGFLLMLQLAFGLIFGGNNQWIAELTGFVTGFLLAVVLAPGGWNSLVSRMRERS